MRSKAPSPPLPSSNANPKGFDHPRLLKQMYLKDADAKAQAQWSSEESEIQGKATPPESGDCEELTSSRTRSDAVLTQITGQLIRTGIFQDRAFSEAIPFVLQTQDASQPQHGRERAVSRPPSQEFQI